MPQAYNASRQRVQHYVVGSLPTRGLAHELVSLKGVANVAVGVVDGHLWIQFSTATRYGIPNAYVARDAEYRTLFDEFAYPLGKQWRREDSLIHQAPDIEGTFDAN